MNWMQVSIGSRCHTFQHSPPPHADTKPRSLFRLLRSRRSGVNRFRSTLPLRKSQLALNAACRIWNLKCWDQVFRVWYGCEIRRKKKTLESSWVWVWFTQFCPHVDRMDEVNQPEKTELQASQKKNVMSHRICCQKSLNYTFSINTSCKGRKARSWK